MPPKRRSSSPASGTRKEVKKAQAADKWPIFYWKGVCDMIDWKGTWVASTDGLPSDDAFEASVNSFKVKFSDDPFVQFEDDSRELIGWFQVDGKECVGYDKIAFAHYPNDHPFACKEDPEQGRPCVSHSRIIGGQGCNEFGMFKSLGRMDVHDFGGNATLTIARRYVSEHPIDFDNPLCKLSAEDMAGRVRCEASKSTHWETPWTALP